jgi:hypothetical protein
MHKILLLLAFLAAAPSLPGMVARGLGVLGVVAVYTASVAHAQEIRQLPVNGKRGKTGDQKPLPQVVIGRETFVLAPGGLIYDTHNRTILHQALPVGADVWYQANNQGQLQRIYVLRPEERARLDAGRKWYEF